MICKVCNKRDFVGSASSVVGVPYLSSGDEPLGRVHVTVEMLFTCRTCGNKVSGTQTSDHACIINHTATKYPLRMYEFVRQSYGDGWNDRAEGLRLTAIERDNPSMVKGWEDAQAHSESRGGKAPPKGWGHARSREYLKTEAACHHLKMISLGELST